MPTFDPAQALRIDLARGQLTLAGSGERLLLPLDALVKLLQSSDIEAVKSLGAAMGTDMGRRIAERLGSSIGQAGVELYIEHLGGELALAGLGNLSLERWGHAVVLVVEGLKEGQALDALVASLLEAAVQRSLSRDATAVSLGRQNQCLKIALLGSHIKSQVESAILAGKNYGEVLSELHQTAKGSTLLRGES